ncbi:hypothetical protein M405DRAFT_820400, partial [Rhizopogon salebrosus TDB-379]
MFRPRHFRSPSPTISMQSLYAARRPVRMKPPWRSCSLAAYLFKTLGDTKGIYSQALIPFQPGMRGTRDKTARCTSIQVRFGCVSLLTEWLIICDRTEAAYYTKFWNDLR